MRSRYMEAKMCRLLSLFAFLLSLSSCYCEGEDQAQKAFDFDVKPGGVKHDFEGSLDTFVCKFEYQCQGGTNEKWHMVIQRMNKEKKEYSCYVERPDGNSYLFFMNFSLSAKGSVIVGTLLHSNGDKTLNPDEYKVDSQNNKVHSVDGAFKSQVARIIIYANEETANKAKQDL